MMPNVWTHIHFAESVVEKADIPIAEREKPVLAFGAQGPDPFFYDRFWPWTKKKNAVHIGRKIHHEQCGPFLMAMIDEARQKNERHVSIYTLGFLTHHLLDRKTHPFIHYHAGLKDYRHQKLEICIDTQWMKKNRGIETWNTPVYREIDMGRHLDPAICHLLEALIDRFFPEETAGLPPRYPERAYRDMKSALRVLYDPHGWKNRLLKERIAPFSYRPLEETVDYLNETRRPWCHPCDRHEIYHKSFADLFSEALDEAVTLLGLVRQFFKDGRKKTRAAIKSHLGNISYSTGKAVDQNAEILYTDPLL